MSPAMLLAAVLIAAPPAPPANAAQALKSLPPKFQDEEGVREAQELEAMPKPKTCKDQCEVIKKLMKMSCSRKIHGEKPKPATVQKCEGYAGKTIDACEKSCREKGKIDTAYLQPKKDVPSPAASQGAGAE